MKLIQIEGTNKILLAICKLVVSDTPPPSVQSMLNENHNNNSNEDLMNDSQSSLSSSISPGSNTQPPPHSPLPNPQPPPPPSSSSSNHSNIDKKYNISIVNLVNGDLLREIIYNGEILELKSNSNLLCVNSWNRCDCFDLVTYEHRFTINTCFSQISKSTGRLINPISLGSRWLAFADNKFHSLLACQGGVSNDIEQSYTATMLNTAKVCFFQHFRGIK